MDDSAEPKTRRGTQRTAAEWRIDHGPPRGERPRRRGVLRRRRAAGAPSAVRIPAAEREGRTRARDVIAKAKDAHDAAPCARLRCHVRRDRVGRGPGAPEGLAILVGLGRLRRYAALERVPRQSTRRSAPRAASKNTDRHRRLARNKIMTDTPTTRRATQRLVGIAVLTFAAFAGAHPCPGDGDPGTLDAFVRPGTDELKEVTFSRSARVTVTDAGGDVVGQGEGPLSDLHRFELPPGTVCVADRRPRIADGE